MEPRLDSISVLIRREGSFWRALKTEQEPARKKRKKHAKQREWKEQTHRHKNVRNSGEIINLYQWFTKLSVCWNHLEAH